jgi:hypothetical protein
MASQGIYGARACSSICVRLEKRAVNIRSPDSCTTPIFAGYTVIGRGAGRSASRRYSPESPQATIQSHSAQQGVGDQHRLAIADVADYIETLNRTRRHGYLCGVSPEQFEAAHPAATLCLPQTPYTLKRLRLAASSDRLDASCPSSCRSSTRSGSSSGHARPSTWRSLLSVIS